MAAKTLVQYIRYGIYYFILIFYFDLNFLLIIFSIHEIFFFKFPQIDILDVKVIYRFRYLKTHIELMNNFSQNLDTQLNGIFSEGRMISSHH